MRTRGHRFGTNTNLPLNSQARFYSVTVDVSGELIKDPEAEMRMAMARRVMHSVGTGHQRDEAKSENALGRPWERPGNAEP